MPTEPSNALVLPLLSTFSITPITPTINAETLVDTRPELPILLATAVSSENKSAIPIALRNEAVFGDIFIYYLLFLSFHIGELTLNHLTYAPLL